MMNVQMEQRVRERAYQIWIEAGQASGFEDDHWHEALREVTALDKAAPMSKRAVAKTRSVEAPAKAVAKPTKTTPPVKKATPGKTSASARTRPRAPVAAAVPL